MSSLTGAKSWLRVDSRIFLALLAVVVYIGAVIWRFDSVPPSINTDAAEEIESGFRVVRDGRLVVMAFDPSRTGVETLWVSLSGFAVKFFGHTQLSALVSSWLAVGLLLVILVLIARRSEGRLDPLIVVLVAASMPWLFHYGHAAMRCISAAMFMSGSLLGLALMFSRRRSWLGPALLGATLALGVYSYTASRVAVIGYALFVLGHLIQLFWKNRGEFQMWLIHHSRAIAVGSFVSIPNVIFAIKEPQLFFNRGVSYNIMGSPRDWAWHVFESLTVPIFYDLRRYSDVGDVSSDVAPKWLFDPAAAVLPAAGISPVWPVIGVVALLGVVLMIRKWRGPMLACAIFGMICYVLTCTLVGFTGPSLSRLSINIPLIALSASALLSALRERFRRIDWISIALVALALVGMNRYHQSMTDEIVQSLFGKPAREIAEQATMHSRQGEAVAVFLRRHFSIFDFYVSDHRANVSVAEFSRKPFDRAKVDPNLMDNSSVIIIQRDEMFEAFIAELNRSNQFEQSSIQADYITFARREFPR